MSKRISENELFLPALYVICECTKASTTQIKNELIRVFKPSGEDNKILAGRKDTKFSQIVRNLMGSHYESNGMKECTEKDKYGYFSLTEAGKILIDDNREYLKYMFENSFAYEDIKNYSSQIHLSQNTKHIIYVYSEQDTVMEGKAEIKSSIIRKRSAKLRDAAIQYYTENGKIVCSACGFDFSEVYGEYGEGYIQIHHEKPIFQYSNEGFASYISEAVKGVKPLCPNCHCMIHKNRNAPISVDELKAIIEKARKTSRN